MNVLLRKLIFESCTLVILTSKKLQQLESVLPQYLMAWKTVVQYFILFITQRSESCLTKVRIKLIYKISWIQYIFFKFGNENEINIIKINVWRGYHYTNKLSLLLTHGLFKNILGCICLYFWHNKPTILTDLETAKAIFILISLTCSILCLKSHHHCLHFEVWTLMNLTNYIFFP